MKKGTPKDTFVLLGRRSKRSKDKQTLKLVCLVKSEICDAYTRLFGTRQEPQKFIKFSAFSGNIFLQILAVLRKIDIIRLLAFSGHYTFNFKNNINKNSIRKNFADIFVFSKNVLKRRKLLKNYFNIRLNFIYLLYSFDGLSI